jgi:hypothetical protein
VILQLLDELERVVVSLAHRERLGREIEALLKVAELVGKERAVEEGLEHVRRHCLHCSKVGTRSVDVPLAQLEHTEVGVRLSMVRVDGDCDLKRLRATRVVVVVGGQCE